MGDRSTGNKRKKIVIAVLATDAILVAAVLVGWWMMKHRPPRPTADPVTLAKFASTPEFANLSEDQKTPYLLAIKDNLPAILAAAERGQMSHDEQVNAMHNVIRSRARMESKAYHALAPGPARQAQLDKIIDEQEQLRQKSAQTGQQVGPNPMMLKQFVESLAPDERIQLASFVFDMLKRRQERGLPGWPFSGSAQ